MTEQVLNVTPVATEVTDQVAAGTATSTRPLVKFFDYCVPIDDQNSLGVLLDTGPRKVSCPHLCLETGLCAIAGDVIVDDTITDGTCFLASVVNNSEEGVKELARARTIYYGEFPAKEGSALKHFPLIDQKRVLVTRTAEDID